MGGRQSVEGEAKMGGKEEGWCTRREERSAGEVRVRKNVRILSWCLPDFFIPPIDLPNNTMSNIAALVPSLKYK
jgi:hypothetical protein